MSTFTLVNESREAAFPKRPHFILGTCLIVLYHFIFWRIFSGVEGVIYTYFHIIPNAEDFPWTNWNFWLAMVSYVAIHMTFQVRIFEQTVVRRTFGIFYDIIGDKKIAFRTVWASPHYCHLQVLDFIKQLKNDFWIRALNIEHDISDVGDGASLSLSEATLADIMAYLVFIDSKRHLFDEDDYAMLIFFIHSNLESMLTMMHPKYAQMVLDNCEDFPEDTQKLIAKVVGTDV